MLKRPLPVRSRRLAALAFITALTGAVTYIAWAAQPLVAPGPNILVRISIKVTNPDAHTLNEYTTMYSVHSGEMVKDKNNGEPLSFVGHFAFGCTPYLTDAPGQSTDWSEQLAHGNSLPATGDIPHMPGWIHDSANSIAPRLVCRWQQDLRTSLSSTANHSIDVVDVQIDHDR